MPKNINVIVAIIAVVVFVVIIFFFNKEQEHLEDLFYLDQIAMKSSDPTYVKYIGRERDVLGMSYRDYYTENRMYSNSGAGPQLLESDTVYFNQNDYLGMPEQYRPKPLTKYVKE